MKRHRLTLLLTAGLLVLAGCADSGDDAADAGDDGPGGTLVTVVEAQRETIEVTERTIGRITSRTRPTLAAEVSGRILAVGVEEGQRVATGDRLAKIDPEPYQLALAQATTDVSQLQVRLRNQQRELERNRELLQDGYVTQSEFDTVEAEVESLEEQLEGARVQRRNAERDLRYTEVTAPVAGVIDERQISEGDFVSAGAPLFRLLSQDALRIRLPFPESVAARLEAGQMVRMETPLAVNGVVESTISELRPGLSGSGRAIEAIAATTNPGGWRDGGSVTAEVVVEERDTVLVPNESVIQRPAGEVVFVIENDTAHERSVRVGVRQRDRTEIRDGLEPGEPVARDGAGFLTDGAAIRTGQE